MTEALDYCEDYENNDDNDWNTSTFKQTLPQHKVYREVARTLAQMHSIELPEGRRSPGAFPSDLFELRLNKKRT